MAKHICKIPDPPADTTRWMGTYGDMVTLLMAFFVMLFAVSDTNAQKFEAFISGLAGPFDNQSLSLGLLDGDSSQVQVSPIALIAPGHAEGQVEPTRVGPMNEVDRAAADAEAAAEQQLAHVEAGIEQALSTTTVPIQVDIRDSERGLVVTISTDDVLFEVGSAVMSEDGRQLITQIAPVLIGSPNTVIVEGHTDDQPMDRGGYTNWNLSTDRAVAVVQLMGSTGFPMDRIAAGGYGEHRPLVGNDSPDGRAINRRVEILVVGLDLTGGLPELESATTTTPPTSSSPVTTAPVGTPTAEESEIVSSDDPGALDFSEAIPPRGSTPVASILGG